MDKKNYMKIAMPQKETDMGYTMWKNIEQQKGLDPLSKFTYIFAFFFNLGKYNKDPIDPTMEELIKFVEKQTEGEKK